MQEHHMHVAYFKLKLKCIYNSKQYKCKTDRITRYQEGKKPHI